ncbi:hypothetical protein ACF06W_11420 [Streptomyces albus]|uniref:hypothetical protein n=1 Tax=Streptomyces albus TaxID=1888 RepID=UPI0037010601
MLSETDAPNDAFPDLPVSLRAKGFFAEPVDGVEIAEVEIRLSPEQLANLVAQARAVQLQLATRARRAAEEAAESAEIARAGQVLRDPGQAQNDTGTLCRVVRALYEMPERPPAEAFSPRKGDPLLDGSADSKPSGDVRNAG